VGERPLGFDRFRPHFVDGAVTTATVDPCKKPRPQSGLLRQVPPALEAATDAMSAIPRAEARPRHQAVPQIRLLATIRRSMPFIERRKCLSWSAIIRAVARASSNTVAAVLRRAWNVVASHPTQSRPLTHCPAGQSRQGVFNQQRSIRCGRSSPRRAAEYLPARSAAAKLESASHEQNAPRLTN
jgi:hypothetical protein